MVDIEVDVDTRNYTVIDIVRGIKETGTQFCALDVVDDPNTSAA